MKIISCPHCNKKGEHKETSILFRFRTDKAIIWQHVMCENCKYIYVDFGINESNPLENNPQEMNKFIQKHSEEIEEIKKINESHYHDWKNRKLTKKRFIKGVSQ